MVKAAEAQARAGLVQALPKNVPEAVLAQATANRSVRKAQTMKSLASENLSRASQLLARVGSMPIAPISSMEFDAAETAYFVADLVLRQANLQKRLADIKLEVVPEAPAGDAQPLTLTELPLLGAARSLTADKR